MNYMVIGATGGLGSYITNSLSSYGNYVLAIGRDKDRIEELNRNSGVEGQSIDITSESDLDSLFSSIEPTFDGLIYCAGTHMDGTISMNSYESLIESMKINAVAFSLISGRFIKKKYSSDGASIICISSMASITNPAGMSAYSASKAALNSLVKALSKEAVKRRIRANAILPGYLQAPMEGETIIRSRGETEEEFYNLVDFLLSDKSRYITGGLIEIAGGQ